MQALPITSLTTIIAFLAIQFEARANADPMDNQASSSPPADESTIISNHWKYPVAAYPKPFSRPPSRGNDYDTWSGASGPDVGKTAPDNKRLPSRVDNSTRPQFPPIYRQKWGACGQYAAIASIFTYEMNVLIGTVANSDATRFPAHFSWNMVNNATNNGSEAYHGWEIAKHIGIPTAKSYGGVKAKKIGLWPDGYAIWREAMEYRVTGYRYSPARTVEQLNEARGWLYDRNQPDQNKEPIGGLLAMDGRMTKVDEEIAKVFVTIPEGEHKAGEKLWTRWGPSGFGHGLTCVGYDDCVGYDVNGDGKITNDTDINGDGKVTLADWERGAYIVVNSWGEKWANDGRVYLLYSAMIDPSWERGNYLGRVEVTRYQPRNTLRLKLSCSNRSDLRMHIGVAGDRDATEPDFEFAPNSFNGWSMFGKNKVGRVPLSGPGDSKPIEVGIDITPLLDNLRSKKIRTAKLFLQLGVSGKSDATGELLECAVRTYDSSNKLIQESPLSTRNTEFGEKPCQMTTMINLRSQQ